MAVLAYDRSTTTTELVAAWNALGIPSALVGPADLDRWLGPGDLVLGRLDVLPSVDGVEPGLLELLRQERRGVRVLNAARALTRAHDKLLSAEALVRAGVPHPRTALLRPGRPWPEIELPLVVKPRLGSWGVDVVRCETPEDLERCLEELADRPWFRRRGALVQELVPPQGYDLRLLVADGSVVGAVRRDAAPDEWRTNVSLGGTSSHVTVSDEVARLGLAAARAIGADLVGVDLAPLGAGFCVLELNGAADFDGRYVDPGIDVYEEVARALGLFDGDVRRPVRAASTPTAALGR